MSWARIDDRWHDHPKVVEAGLEAAGLWMMCLTWAHQARRTSPTPGVVPDAVVTRFAGSRAKKLAGTLHRVGLFDDRTDAGWPIHDFDDYLPRYDAEANRERGARGGKAKAAKQTAKRTASKPLDEPLAETLAVPDETAKQTSSTRASARRYPVPVPVSEPNGSESATPTAQTITAAWIDAIRATGTEPTKSMIGQASRAAKELLDGGNDPERVLAAARAAGTAGYATIDRQLASMNGRPQHLQPVTSKVELNPWRFR